MKKSVAYLFPLVVIVLVLAFNSPVQGSVAVQIPDPLKLVLDGFLIAAMTAATVWIFEHTNLDLQGSAVSIGLSVSTWVITELQNFINTIPVQYDPIVNTILTVLVVILVPVGILRLLSRRPATLI